MKFRAKGKTKLILLPGATENEATEVEEQIKEQESRSRQEADEAQILKLEAEQETERSAADEAQSLDKEKPETAQDHELKFQALQLCKLRSASRLRKCNKSLFINLLIILLALKFFFGSMALTAALTALVVCAVLSSLILSRVYRLNVDQSGLHFRIDQFRSLSLNWEQLKSFKLVQETNGISYLSLSPVPGCLGKIQRWYFQDLIGPDNSINIIPQALKPDESPVEPESRIESFLEYCKQNYKHACFESDDAGGVLSELKIAEPAPESGTYMLDYFPRLAYLQARARFMKKWDKALSILLILIAAKITWSAGVFPFLQIFGFVLSLSAIELALFQANKMKLRLSKEGLSYVWNFPTEIRSKNIDWSKVKSVYLAHSKDIDGRAKKAEFLIAASDKKEKQELKVLSSFCGTLFKARKEDFVLSIDLNSLTKKSDKFELLKALNKYLPAELIDKDLIEELNPTDTASYTQLWLESLSVSTQERHSEEKLAPGQFLKNGGFEIIEFLGAGGQASAYVASDRNAEEGSATVVLKEFILPSHAGAELSLRSLDHIKKEFELMKTLEHDNIVRYYDLFVEDHRCYLVLEHLEGKSLRQLVEDQGALAEDQILALAEQMALILKHLHSQDPVLIHRDFSPDNLILDKSGKLKLIDFNLAQQLEENARSCIVGKHSYLPPEQFRGRASCQSDIYALGASLYYLCTAEDPEPISASNPILKNEQISDFLDSLVFKATQLELADRFQSADEILAALFKHSTENKVRNDDKSAD